MPSHPPATNPYRTPEPPRSEREPASGRRRRTGLLLLIGTALVIVLAAFGVTGFAYPGWFLDTDAKQPSASAGGLRHGPRDAGRTPEGTTNSALDYLNSGDVDGFGSLACPQRRDRMLRTIDDYDPRLSASSNEDTERIGVDYNLEDIGSRGPHVAVARITENFDNLPKRYRKVIPYHRFDGELTLTQHGGRWKPCGIRFTIPGGTSSDQPEAPASPAPTS